MEFLYPNRRWSELKLGKSSEDYLKAILIIQKEKGEVRSVDLARYMGFSKPSISHAVKVLREGGFLSIDGDGFLHLTVQGKEVAENIYEKHQFFTMHLIEVGVNPVQAEADACMMEHCISEESFQKIREVINKGRTARCVKFHED